MGLGREIREGFTSDLEREAARKIVRAIDKWRKGGRIRTAQRRWLFELIQNAVDISRERGTPLEVNITTGKNEITFEHNAGYFTPQEIRALIYAYSTKPYERGSDLAGRFAFIVKTDNLTQKQKEHLFRNRFMGESKLSEHSQLFDQWVKLAKTHAPKIKASQDKVDEFVKNAVKIVDKHATTKLRRDLRMGDYLRRIAMAFARIEFTDVTDEVIDKAYGLIKESIDVWRFKAGDLDFL